MPKRPRHPCSYSGCPNLTDGRYCEEHAKQEARRYEKFERDPTTRRRYGRAWKRIRDRYIAAHPLCEQCQKEGRITPAQEIHHVLPLSHGGTHSEDNLRSRSESWTDELREQARQAATRRNGPCQKEQ